MNSLEKYLWASFTSTVVSIGLYAFMVGGAEGGLQTVPFSLFGVFVGVVTVFTILQIISASVFLGKDGKGGADERDQAIELKGFRNGYYALFGMINVLLLVVLLSLNLGEAIGEDVMLTRPEYIFHALFIGTFLIHGIETGSRLYFYRRGLK